MPLRYGLQSSRDLFEKLKADAAALEKEVTSYGLFNFVVAAYHLCQWIEKDPAVPKSAKQAVAAVRADQNIAVCRDLTNATKHFTLRGDYKNQVANAAISSVGFGIGRYGHGGFGVGEEKIEVELMDGSIIDVLDLKNNVVAIWTSFFQIHGI